MARSYATDCREPCQDRDIAALSGFAPCAIRALCSSRLRVHRVGTGVKAECTVLFKKLTVFQLTKNGFFLAILVKSLYFIAILRKTN